MRYVNLAIIAALLGGTITETVLAQGRGFRGGRGPGGRGHGPDSEFVADRDDFHFLLEHHADVRRQVTELANGVQTLTESDNPEVAARVQKHVAAMYQRVEQRHPIRMRDPLFAEIFRHADKITMEFQQTPKGVRVVETSDDEYVVKLIKSHAKVVSGFSKFGFQEARKTHPIPGARGTGDGSIQSHQESAFMVFVEFDRAYIPALALTNQKKLPAATKSLERLNESWNMHFVGQFHGMFKEDQQWPRDVSRIAQAIALAGFQLESGAPQTAHETLEPVREILMDARRRNEVEYPLDSLSRFHATMEAIVKPAMKTDGGSLSDRQIEQFATLAKQAKQEWQEVENTKFDLAMFGKDLEQQQEFPSMLRAERKSLERLATALETNNKQSIVKAARGLKPPFARIYMFFGDFAMRPHATR